MKKKLDALTRHNNVLRIAALTESIDNKLCKKVLIVQPNIAQLRLIRVVSSRLG